MRTFLSLKNQIGNKAKGILKKRNGKKEPVKATGVRSRESSSYTPNQNSRFQD